MFNNVTLIGYLRLRRRIPQNPQQLDPDGPFARDKANLEEPRNGRTRIANDVAQMCLLRAYG